MTPAPPVDSSRPVEDPRPIYTSATKIVFLMLALTLCVAFMVNKVTQENFVFMVGMVFSYYFGKSQSTTVRTPSAHQEQPK